MQQVVTLLINSSKHYSKMSVSGSHIYCHMVYAVIPPNPRVYVCMCAVFIFVGVVCVCLCVAYPYEFPAELHAYLSLWLSSTKCRVLSYLTFSGFISILVARNSRTNSHRGQTAIIKFPKVNGLTWHSESLTYLIPCIFSDSFFQLYLSLTCSF